MTDTDTTTHPEVEPPEVDPDTDTVQAEPDVDPDADPDRPDSFPRAYVERLRREAAEARVRADLSDTLAGALWEARITATGRLADPTDLPMPAGADPADPDTVDAAITALLARKPHLASRRPAGDIGQGQGNGEPVEVDLAAMMRARA